MNKKKSVFVLLLGETNAGKSTIVNHIIQAKVSIVSHKVQTTRFKILGIYTKDSDQIIFVDTPGIFDSKRNYDKEMVSFSLSQINEVDIVAIVVDCNKGITSKVIEIIDKVPLNKKSIFIFNKVDLINKEKLLVLINQVKHYNHFDKFFMISALKKKGLNDLIEYIKNNTVHDNWFYDEDQISDLPLKHLASEITREKIYKYLHQELPYQISVVHDKWHQTDSKIEIYQTIFVTRVNYKGMILGKSGSTIKKIRVEATQDLERELGKQIILKLYVKVSDKIFSEYNSEVI